MSRRLLPSLLVGVSLFAACTDDSTPSPAGSSDAGGGGGNDASTPSPDASTPADAASADTGGEACGSMSCNVAADGTCDEYPAPSSTQCDDLPAACSNRGGTL